MRWSVALLALFPCAVLAQSLDDGTLDVYFDRITRKGELEGCSLVFTTVTRDYAYLQGAQVVLNGSIALRTLNGTDLFFTAKLGTRQWLATGPGAWEPPVHFHFATKNASTAKHGRIGPSETEGYRLLIASGFTPEILKLVREMSEAGAFTVGFNRKPDGQDVATQVQMNVALRKDASGETRKVQNEQTQADFYQCFARLANEVIKKLPK